jgi:hypothetical protein
MTTEKDAAKLRMLPGAEEVLYLRIGVEIDEGRDRLLDMVDACLEKRER